MANPICFYVFHFPGCFPGSSVVTLENGERKKMSDIRIGDSVMAVGDHGELVFSPIILDLHKEPEKRDEYLVIRTNTNQSISLSHNHLIYTKHQEEKKKEMDLHQKQQNGHIKHEFNPDFAENVKKGDLVIFSDSIHKLTPSTVVSVEKVIETGVYSPLTTAGNIFVDGILASCYSDFDNHQLQHFAMAPFRWWNKVSGFFTSTKRETENVSPLQDHSGVHWYSQGLHSFAKTILPWKVKY